RTTFLTSVITCSLDECYRRSERHQPKAPILPLRSEHLQGARQAWGSSFGLPDRWPWCGPGGRLFAPGAGAPTGWGGAFNCRSTASVRTESNQYTEPAHSHPGRVLLPVLRGNEKAPASFDARAFDMAQRTGLEPATPGVTGRYSNRLNYRCASV